jgi:hypothetical protein
MSSRGAPRSTATGASHPDARPGRTRARSRAGRAVVRRRRFLLGLALLAAASIRVRYVVGGHWWIAEAIAVGLLCAYLVALVARGFRRHPPRRALPPAPARSALPPPRPAAVAMPPPEPPPKAPSGRRRPRWRRRREGDGPLWSGPLLEGQGPPAPE